MALLTLRVLAAAFSVLCHAHNGACRYFPVCFRGSSNNILEESRLNIYGAYVVVHGDGQIVDFGRVY